MEESQSTVKIPGSLLRDTLKLQIELNKICDNKANFILGISGVLIVLSLSQVTESVFALKNIGFLVIILSSFFSAALSVYAIKPKNKKRIKRADVFFFGSFLEIYTREEYVEKHLEILSNPTEWAEQYASEIYDFAKEDLQPRFLEVKKASLVLLSGLTLGIFIIILSLFI